MTTFSPAPTAKERRERAARHRTAQEAGDKAVEDFKAALARVGLVLPSLRSEEPVDGSGFVTLGGCNVQLATRLAEVINAGADALQAADR